MTHQADFVIIGSGSAMAYCLSEDGKNAVIVLALQHYSELKSAYVAMGPVEAPY